MLGVCSCMGVSLGTGTVSFLESLFGRRGESPLTANEYKTAEGLGKDYWLYAVFNCASEPELHAVLKTSYL